MDSHLVVFESFWMFHSFFLVHSRISTGNHQKTSRPNRVVYDFLGKSVNSKSPKYRVVMSGKPSWRVCIQQRFVELKFSFEAENHTANEIYFQENHQANPFKQNNGSMSVDFPGRGCDTKTLRRLVQNAVPPVAIREMVDIQLGSPVIQDFWTRLVLFFKDIKWYNMRFDTMLLNDWCSGRIR